MPDEFEVTLIEPVTYEVDLLDATQIVAAEVGLPPQTLLKGPKGDKGDQGDPVDLTSVNSDIIPDLHLERSLGSPEIWWKDIYVGPGSFYVAGQKVVSTTDLGQIVVTADPNQALYIQTSGTADLSVGAIGTGNLLLKSNAVFQAGKKLLASDGTSIQFGSDVGFDSGKGVFGDLLVRGNVTITGTTTVISTNNLVVQDNIITVNKGETGPGVTLGYAGIDVDRGPDDNKARLIWDEGQDAWKGGLLGSELRFLTTGNTGAGNGLDADKLDGNEGTYYINYNNLINKPTIPTTDDGYY